MDLIKWQLNFGSCNFGLKSYFDFKSNSLCALPVRLWNHSYDFRPNCTPLSPITMRPLRFNACSWRYIVRTEWYIFCTERSYRFLRAIYHLLRTIHRLHREIFRLLWAERFIACTEQYAVSTQLCSLGIYRFSALLIIIASLAINRFWCCRQVSSPTIISQMYNMRSIRPCPGSCSPPTLAYMSVHQLPNYFFKKIWTAFTNYQGHTMLPLT